MRFKYKWKMSGHIAANGNVVTTIKWDDPDNTTTTYSEMMLGWTEEDYLIDSYNKIGK